MYVVAIATDKPGVADVRSQARDAYRAYLRDHPAHEGVTVHHAGPTLGDDGESPTGALVLMEAPSLEAARSFMADSPFGKAGIFAECEIRQLDWITGRPG